MPDFESSRLSSGIIELARTYVCQNPSGIRISDLGDGEAERDRRKDSEPQAVIPLGLGRRCPFAAGYLLVAHEQPY